MDDRLARFFKTTATLVVKSDTERNKSACDRRWPPFQTLGPLEMAHAGTEGLEGWEGREGEGEAERRGGAA